MAFFLPDRITCNGDSFKPLISREKLEERIHELGKQISEDYKEKRPIFIGVLNGAFMFLADLMKSVEIPCEVDFIKLSSYGDEKVSSGKVTDKKQIDADIEGRHVILVEDIVDTGLSIRYLIDKIKTKKPESVSVITLLHKQDATVYDVDIDYIGFKIPTLFVLGYGLDYAQEGRNLAQIYVIDEKSTIKD